MRKIIKFGFVSVLLVLIGFSSILPVLAADDWLVEEGDELVFNLTVWDEDDITVDGPFTLTIEEINSTGELMYSINTDFEIDEEDADDDLEVDDVITIGAVYILWFIILLWSEDAFNEYLDDLSDIFDDMEDILDTLYGDNDSFTYNVEELEYGLEYSVEDTELEESSYLKMQWDENGILKHWEMTYVEDEEKSGFLVKKKGFDFMGFINSIPGYPIGLVLGIFAVSTIGILILNKKSKNH